MNPQFIYYNALIEKEHRKPEDQKNLALIDDWKTERAKYFDSTDSALFQVELNYYSIYFSSVSYIYSRKSY